MKTKAINDIHRFFNIFTKTGRAKNKVYRELYNNHILYLRERKLPDKSTVILGYETPATKTNSFAYKLNPDYSIQKKSYEENSILNLFSDLHSSISKAHIDNTGKVIEREVKNIRLRGDKIIGRMKYYLSERLLKQSYEGAFTDLIESDGRPINKAYRRLITTDGKTNLYSIFEFKDGTKEYKKHINGVDYFFRTAKK